MSVYYIYSLLRYQRTGIHYFSDSDFVRLDALSSSSSSNENSDTEGDEVFREELSAPSAAEVQAAATTIDVMAESVSSVSSGFRFLPQQIQPGT